MNIKYHVNHNLELTALIESFSMTEVKTNYTTFDGDPFVVTDKLFPTDQEAQDYIESKLKKEKTGQSKYEYEIKILNELHETKIKLLQSEAEKLNMSLDLQYFKFKYEVEKVKSSALKEIKAFYKNK